MTTADYKAAAKELRQLNYELHEHRLYCENVKQMVKPEDGYLVRERMKAFAMRQAIWQAFADAFFNVLVRPLTRNR